MWPQIYPYEITSYFLKTRCAKRDALHFLTSYLRYALASIGIKNVHFFPLQGLVFGPETVAQAVQEARRQLFGK